MPGIPSGNKQLQMAGLDDLGNNSRGDNITLRGTARVLVRMADTLINSAIANLNKSGSDASGFLADNIQAQDIEINGSSMSLEITMPEYGLFLDKGVKGVDSGQGEYSFKKRKPGRSMVASIKSWLTRRGGRADKYKPLNKGMRKDQAIGKRVAKAGDKLDSLAWAIATNVKKKGIKPTYFFTKAMKNTEREFRKELEKGFKIDIINSFK